MSATNELFGRWKAHKRIESDREAAAILGVSHGTPHHWRQGRNGAASVIERMAKDLGEDPIPVILQAFSEASRDAEDKRTLARMAKRLGAACLALIALAPWSQPATAQAHSEGFNASPVYTLCALAHNAIEAVRGWLRDFLEQSPCSPLALYPVRR